MDFTALGSHQGSEGLADLLNVAEAGVLSQGLKQVGGGRGQLELLGHRLSLFSEKKKKKKS